MLDHIVCKHGLLVNLAKIVVILDLVSPGTFKQLHVALGHKGYYRKYMHDYAQITMPLEKLFKKDTPFIWKEECQKLFDELKEKLVSAPILVFPDWLKIFHVHVDALSIALGTVLTHPGEGEIDHPISFASIKLSTT